MKKYILGITTLSLLVLFAISEAALAGKGPGGGNMDSLVANLPAEELNQQEREGLLFMYEEEKLARDVYSALHAMWGDRVFANIASSEQQHMDSIKALLVKYSVPAPDDAANVYQEQALQSLFEQLTTKARESLAAALHVGATIEDLDIVDLRAHLSETDNRDIAIVYQNLMKGSRNHMRSFGALLASMGQPYGAQYLSQDEVQAILDSDRERGVLDENGQPL